MVTSFHSWSLVMEGVVTDTVFGLLRRGTPGDVSDTARSRAVGCAGAVSMTFGLSTMGSIRCVGWLPTTEEDLL